MTRTSEKFSTFSALIFQLILLHLSLCTCDQSFQKAKDKCPDGQALDLNGKCIKKFVLPQRKDCPQPDIRFGGYDLEFGGRIANFWCEDGWTLASQTLGQNHATCKLGAWDRPLPSCVKSGIWFHFISVLNRISKTTFFIFHWDWFAYYLRSQRYIRDFNWMMTGNNLLTKSSPDR